MNSKTSHPDRVHEFSNDELNPPSSLASARTAMRFLDVHELFDLKAPEYLIHGVLPSCAIAGIVGKRSTMKTFLALGFGLCVATDTPWCSRSVLSGSVLYVAAEGAREFKKRVQAWCKEHGFDAKQVLDKRFFVYPRALNLLDPDSVAAFVEAISRLQPRPLFIVIDTLARCFGDGDENVARDMNSFVRACEEMQAVTGATVLIVHHATKSGPGPRGSSSFECALDTLITTQRKDSVVTLVCAKQKNDLEFEPIRLRTKVLVVDTDIKGDDVTSCVLVPSSSDSTQSDRCDELKPRDLMFCQLIWDLVQRGSVNAITLADRLDFSDSEFGRVTQRLRRGQYIEEVGASKPKVYKLTERGVCRVSQNVPRDPNGRSGTSGHRGPKSQLSHAPIRAGRETRARPGRARAEQEVSRG